MGSAGSAGSAANGTGWPFQINIDYGICNYYLYYIIMIISISFASFGPF